jgi:hypothetical protein
MEKKMRKFRGNIKGGTFFSVGTLEAHKNYGELYASVVRKYGDWPEWCSFL